MQSEPPNNNDPQTIWDPQTVWQSQITEEMKMSLTILNQRADQHRAQARRMVVAGELTYLALVASLAFIGWNVPSTTARAGLLLLAAGGCYSLYRRHKELWPVDLAPGAPPATGVETYRRELLVWRDDARNVWRMLAPVIPGAILFVVATIAPHIHAISRNPAVLKNALPVCVLFVIWLALLIPTRRRKIQKIQQEIDLVDGLVGHRPEPAS